MVLIHQNPYQGLKRRVYTPRGKHGSSANSSKSLSGIETFIGGDRLKVVAVLIHQNPYQGLKHRFSLKNFSARAVLIHQNPYQGLKLNLSQACVISILC